MQTVNAAFTAEEKDRTRSIAHNLRVSWKKDNILGNRTFTIGVSAIGGSDVIGINPGAIGSPGLYRYFDESAYVKALAWERGLSMPVGGISKAMAEALLVNQGLPGYGYSLSLDATTNAEASSASTTLGLTSANIFTFSAWIKPAVTMSSSNRDTVWGCADVASGFQFEAGGGAGTMRVSALISGTFVATSATDNVLLLNQWNHVVYTRSGTGAGTHKIYVNGVLQSLATDAATNYADTASVKIIGGRTVTTSQKFNGKITQVKFWNQVLTSSEILDLYYGQHPSTTPFIEFALAEGSGTTAYQTGTNTSFPNMTLDSAATYSADAPHRRGESGRFTPHYMGGDSELFTAILPRRPMIINAGFDVDGVDITLPQFAGILDRQPELDKRSSRLRLHAADYIDFFQNRFVDQTAIYTSQPTDVVIENLLVNAGLSTAQYELDSGINTIPFAMYEKGSQLSEIINELVAAERGQFYQDEEGILRFENRQHWDNSPHNSISKVIYTAQVLDAGVPSEHHIINVVEVKGKEFVKQPLQPIMNFTSPVEIEAGETVGLFFQYDGPVLQVTTPTIGGTDSYYEANTDSSGEGTDYTSSVVIKSIDNFATSSKINFKNNASVRVFLTKVVISGRIAKPISDIYVRLQDDSSVTAFEERSLVIENKFIQDKFWAPSLAQMILNDFSEPESLQRIVIKAMPSLQMGDLISWQGRYWRIINIRSTLNPEEGFLQELTLLQRAIQSYFRIGISTIGGSDVIAP